MLQKKDDQGLSFVYRKYSAAIYGIILRIVKDKEASEEVLQQTILNVWNRFDTYNPQKSALFTWISRIARNAAIDKTRLKSYQNQKRSESLDSIVYLKDTQEQVGPKVDVSRLTQNLEEKYKIVLDKIYLEGYTQSEVAKELDIPLGTVKTRLKKALSILREELKDEKDLFLGLLWAPIISFFLCP